MTAGNSPNQPQSESVSLEQLQLLVKNKLWLKVLVGMVLGVLLGLVLSADLNWFSREFSAQLTPWIAFPGRLFVRLIQMIMIPLVLSSIILGISGNQDVEGLRKMGISLLGYFLLTTAVAIGLGIAMYTLLRNVHDISRDPLLEYPIMGDTGTKTFHAAEIPERILNVLPANPLASMVSGEMLGIVVFSIIIGLAVLTLRKDLSSGIQKLLLATQEISITITKWAMNLAPIAVFGLLCEVTAQVGISALSGLLWYTGIVILALLLLVIVYLLVLFLWSGVSPREFFRASKELLLLAFSMSSSAAVMPLTMKTAETALGVRPRLSRFIIPVGATINMDGTAIYQVITTLFLADMYGVGLDLSTLVLLSLTTVAASIGTPSAPGAGVVILGSILGNFGIPVAAIGIIIGVERLLGMFRTSVNVMGDLTACSVFETLERKNTRPS